MHRRLFPAWPLQRMHACIAVALATAAGVMIGSASAAPIIWSTPQTISSDSDVDISGTLAYAYTIGEEGVPATTVNGVLFDALEFPVGGTTAAAGSVTFTESPGTLDASLGLGSTAAPFVTLSPAYRVLLSSGGYATSATAITATLGDLTIGQRYLLQVWTSNAAMLAPGIGALQETIISSATNQATFDANTTNLVGGLGQFVIGRFTADDVVQDFTLVGAEFPVNLPLINALQVRAVPEPSTWCLALAGLAGGNCVLRRRR